MVNDLERALDHMRQDRDELQARVAELEAPARAAVASERRLCATLANPDAVEEWRLHAWASQPDVLKYWDDAAHEYRYPEGWPEGETGEGYIGRQVGVSAGGPGPEAPVADTLMHRMLRGER
jgi:hypothetical protein